MGNIIQVMKIFLIGIIKAMKNFMAIINAIGFIQ